MSPRPRTSPCTPSAVRSHPNPVLSTRPQSLSQRVLTAKLLETLLSVPETGMWALGGHQAGVGTEQRLCTARPSLPPSAGAFDLEQVKHSTYFFS